MTLKISVIQMNSGTDVAANLATAERLIRDARRDFAADLYVLPEYSPFVGGTLEDKRAIAEDIPLGKACIFYGRLAAELEVAIHCGTINELSLDKMFNTSVVFGPDGQVISKYRKIYLLDAMLPTGRLISESKIYTRGNSIATFTYKGYEFGCAVCYDLRFPELFRAMRMRGSEIFLFVAAWPKPAQYPFDPSVVARALDNQAYMVVSTQCGRYHNNERENYAATMIADPWGKIQARLDDKPGYINYEIDIEALRNFRRIAPVARKSRDIAAAGVYHDDDDLSIGCDPRDTPALSNEPVW